jgi:endonuclease III-like uncharacterized protein
MDYKFGDIVVIKKALKDEFLGQKGIVLNSKPWTVEIVFQKEIRYLDSYGETKYERILTVSKQFVERVIELAETSCVVDEKEVENFMKYVYAIEKHMRKKRKEQEDERKGTTD